MMVLQNLLVEDAKECKFMFVNISRLFESGFFVFHYGSSIGTHQIQINTKEKETKFFQVVVI